MKSLRIAVCLLLAGLVVTEIIAQGRVGRGAGRGAAMGAVFGLLLGGDIDDAVEGAAVGAAAGAVGGAIDNSYARKDRRRYEQQQAQARAHAEARAAEEERRRLEAERRALEAERQALEAQQAAEAQTASSSTDEYSDEEWIAAIGVDNWNALVALVDCQHQRARLLAQAGATVDNPEYRLASRWLEAMIALDVKDGAAADRIYQDLVELDDDIDTPQQAAIEGDKAVLEVRQIRRDEGISCSR
jgi:hypothetical protein